MLSTDTESHAPRIIVISESPSQRLAFGEAVKSMGYELIDCIPSHKLTENLNVAADLWLIDSNDDVDVINKLQDSDKYLLGFTPSPSITDIKAFDKWQRHLKRKLVHIFGEQSVVNNQPKQPIKLITRNWQVVLVLGASMGGPVAVKLFLDSLHHELPIAVVLVQHTDNIAINTLPRILTKDNQWQCEVISAKSPLEAGKVLLVPPDYAYEFSSAGWLLPTGKPWQAQYSPSISVVMQSAAEVLSYRVINIFFSGMGNDGSDIVKYIRQSHGKIWVQQPESCECDSQPRHVIDTGMVDFVGNPVQLAEKTSLTVSELTDKQYNSMQSIINV